jgi:hypothetical protein
MWLFRGVGGVGSKAVGNPKARETDLAADPVLRRTYCGQEESQEESQEGSEEGRKEEIRKEEEVVSGSG